MDIGRQLRNLLDQERISQKELAKALNISDSTLSGYVKNRRQPDAKTVIRIASYTLTTRLNHVVPSSFKMSSLIMLQLNAFSEI